MKLPLKTLKIAAVVSAAFIILVLAVRASTVPIEFGNDYTRAAAAQSILADRAKTITQLEDVVTQDVDKPDKQEAVRTAMVLLGKLHADQAAPLLVPHLSFFVKKDVSSYSGLDPVVPEDVFPAVGALIQMGIPGIDALLYQASQTDDQKDKRSIALTNIVLTRLLGQQPAIAFVTDVIGEQREQKQKDRLTIILTSLQQHPSGPRENPY